MRIAHGAAGFCVNIFRIMMQDKGFSVASILILSIMVAASFASGLVQTNGDDSSHGGSLAHPGETDDGIAHTITSVTSSHQTIRSKAAKQYTVMFDDAHLPAYTANSSNQAYEDLSGTGSEMLLSSLSGGYSLYASALTSSGYNVVYLNTGQKITQKVLQDNNVDVLILPASTESYTSDEKNAIFSFVTNNSGSVFIIGDYGPNGNPVNDISTKFGFVSGGTYARDTTSGHSVNYGAPYNQYYDAGGTFLVLTSSIKKTDAINQAINAGVTRLEFYTSCTFTTYPQNATTLVTTDADANPSNTALAVAFRYEKGISTNGSQDYGGGVAVVGDSNFLGQSYDIDGDGKLDVNDSNNKVFGVHIVNWLASVSSVTYTANTPPTAYISTPSEGQAFSYNALVNLTGYGRDYEDGFLTGTSMNWSSNVTSYLGSGNISLSNLSAGKHRITLTVKDGNGSTAAYLVNISVNRPPVIGQIGGQSAFVGTEFTLQINATDADGDALAYADNSSLFAINASSGLIKFTPTNVQKGNYTIAINITDGKNTANASFVLSIPNRLPAIAAISDQTGTAGAIFTYQTTASDLDGDALSYSLNTTLLSINSTGYISGTPSTVGMYYVKVTVNDTVAESSAAFILNISAVPAGNNPPVISSATSNRTTVNAGEQVSITVVASDANGDNMSYYYSPTGGAITGSGSTVTWTAPAANGTYAIVVTVSDGNLSATAAINMTVLNATTAVLNNPPIISFAAFNTSGVGTGQQATVTVSASDPDGDALSYYYSPSGGTITGSGTTVIWTAPTNIGAYAITVTVSDGILSASEAIGITVMSLADTNTTTNSTGNQSTNGTTNTTTPSNSTNSPPTVSIRTSFGAVVSGIVSINGTASDDTSVASVQIKIDNGEWMNATGTDSWRYTVNTVLLYNGTHTVRVRAYDGTQYSNETILHMETYNLIIDDGGTQGENKQTGGLVPGFESATLLSALGACALIVRGRKRRQ